MTVNDREIELVGKQRRKRQLGGTVHRWPTVVMWIF